MSAPTPVTMTRARPLAALLVAAAGVLVAAGVLADEVPECPPDLGIDEPIGPCGRDGNGPEPHGPTSTTRDPESHDHEDPPPFGVECPYHPPAVDAPEAAYCVPPVAVERHDPAPAPTPAAATPRYTG